MDLWRLTTPGQPAMVCQLVPDGDGYRAVITIGGHPVALPDGVLRGRLLTVQALLQIGKLLGAATVEGPRH